MALDWWWLRSTPGLLGVHLTLLDFGKCSSDQFTIHGTSPPGMRSKRITVTIVIGAPRQTLAREISDPGYWRTVLVYGLYIQSPDPYFGVLRPDSNPGFRLNHYLQNQLTGQVKIAEAGRYRQAINRGSYGQDYQTQAGDIGNHFASANTLRKLRSLMQLCYIKTGNGARRGKAPRNFYRSRNRQYWKTFLISGDSIVQCSNVACSDLVSPFSDEGRNVEILKQIHRLIADPDAG